MATATTRRTKAATTSRAATTRAAAKARAKAGPRSRGRLVFFKEFLRNPRELGSMFTSGKALSRKMVEGIAIDRARAVVELGPGPGPVTEEILARIPPSCRFVAIERNEDLAGALRERFPRLALHVDDAANLRAICEDEGILPGTVDCVVSGLPFLLFPEPLQRRILGEIKAVLKPGGWLAQVTLGSEVMAKTRKFRKVLESTFPTVRRAGPVIANVPPAFVYRCRK